ncbi:hypothetical protein ACA910_021313 [Epithemia clementina (nom. ined.)]
MRIVAKQCHPLVIVLDNLQCADAASLDLLEVLVTDRGNLQLFIVGTYCSNKVVPNKSHLLLQTIRNLQFKSFEFNSGGNDCGSGNASFSLTEIPIGNLDLVAVYRIIHTLLGFDDEQNDDDSSSLSVPSLCNVCF